VATGAKEPARTLGTEGVQLYSRNGHNFADRFPRIVEA
jgi:ATP-dependent DNA ligase